MRRPVLKNHQKLAKEWFDRAEEDLGTANLLLEEKSYPASICFHAHQAVEKYLKGFLVYNGKDIEEKFKIHNLPQLFDYCKEVNKELPISLKEHCFTLNRYYTEARYPGEIPEYPWKEVKKAVEAAERLKEGILKFLKYLG